MSQLSWWSVTRMQLHNHKHTIYRCSKGSIQWHAEAAMNWVVHEFHRYRHLYSRCKTCRAAAKLTADQIFLVVRGLEARQSVGGSVLVLLVEIVESQTRAGGRQTRSFIRNISNPHILSKCLLDEWMLISGASEQRAFVKKRTLVELVGAGVADPVKCLVLFP